MGEKHVRLVRRPDTTPPGCQATRDREAREWADRLTREQRIWELRKRGFFRLGAELDSGELSPESR